MEDLPQDSTVQEESGGGKDDPSGGYEKDSVYIALDGIKDGDLDKLDRERIEERLITFVLGEMKVPLSDVRVLTEEVGVVEFENTDNDAG